MSKFKVGDKVKYQDSDDNGEGIIDGVSDNNDLYRIMGYGGFIEWFYEEELELITGPQETAKNEGAKKNDKKDGKPQYRYLCKRFLDETSYPMMAGVIKYGAYNFMKGHNRTQLLEAAIRHLMLDMGGEDLDKDTTDLLGQDVSHLGCALANINMLLSQLEAGTLTDDRYKGEDSEIN